MMIILKNRARVETIIALVALGIVLVMRKILLEDLETLGIWEWALFSVVFLYIFPFLVIKLIFNAKSRDYNLSFRFEKKKLLLTAGVLLGLVAWLVLVVVKSDWSRSFQVSQWILAVANYNASGVVYFIDFLVLPFAVLASEFFFRGFLMQSVQRGWGAIAAIGVQAVCIVGYLFLPVENFSWLMIFQAMLLNIVFGILAYANRSIFVPAVVNWLILVVFDILAIQKISG